MGGDVEKEGSHHESLAVQGFGGRNRTEDKHAHASPAQKEKRWSAEHGGTKDSYRKYGVDVPRLLMLSVVLVSVGVHGALLHQGYRKIAQVANMQNRHSIFQWDLISRV